MPEQTQIPRILWAQQREEVLLTVAVPDIEKVDVKFEEDSVSFRGQTTSSNAKDNNVYEVKINLYEKIDTEASKYENVGQKFWRLLLKKKDPKGAFWPRLTKDKGRLHWLQTDFDHWKDEDESDDEKAGGMNGNFQDMFSGGMGGMGGMPGMGGMGGMGGMPGMGGMGGMPGMGGMGGMPGMGGMGGFPGMDMGEGSDEEEGDSDDDGIPPLSNEKDGATSTNQGSNKTSAETVAGDKQESSSNTQSA